MSAALLVALLLVPHALGDPSSCAAGSGTCESVFDGVELSLIQSHVKTDSKTKIAAPEKDEVAYLEEQMNGIKSKIQALKSEARAKSQVERQKARLSVEQQAKFDHLHSLIEAVKHGHVDAINGDAFAELLREVSPQDSNVMLSDTKEMVEMLDKNKDGKLDKKEFHDIFYPKIETGKADGDDDDDDDGEEVTPEDAPGEVPPPNPNNASLAQTKTGTQGSWEDFTCCSDFYAQRYSQPAYFKPRIMISSGGLTVKGCYLVGMVFPGSSCWGYLYSNANGNGHGMCRCYPDDASAWKSNGHPDWTWYASGSGNHIYFVR